MKPADLQGLLDSRARNILMNESMLEGGHVTREQDAHQRDLSIASAMEKIWGPEEGTPLPSQKHIIYTTFKKLSAVFCSAH